MNDKLTPFESWVLDAKGTEKPFTGEYTETTTKGTYACRKCDAALYRSDDKFSSQCGWPSFDDEISGAVKRVPDADGRRTEIVCAKCNAHLGHVFEGEGYTAKNIRHCVNSISMVLRPEENLQTEEALLASGCFWGTEFYLTRAPGVVSTEVGYAGGVVDRPTYEQVCGKKTGHVECVRVKYDPNVTTYENIVKLFFETHDFSQHDGQGPDIGPQYKSVVFAKNAEQRAICERVVSELQKKGLEVATEIRDWAFFWKAEDYHQKYYFRNASSPYCHIYRKIF